MQDESVNAPEQKQDSRLILWVVVMGGLLFGAALALFGFSLESLARIEQRFGSLISEAPDIGRSAADAVSAGGPAVGEPAPDFTLNTLDGSEISLSDLRGQAVLINFWASWCIPCREEMPELLRVYEANKEEGFTILALNLTHQDALPDVEAFVEEFDMPFPVLLDETGEVTDMYGLRGIPSSIFVDRTGVIQHVYIGAMDGEQLDQFVAEIMQ